MAQVDWNGLLPQEKRKALAAAGACLVALVGAGWNLFSFGYSRGKDIGQDELAAYKAISAAKLPEVTSALLAVNKELRESLNVFDRNKTLEAENVSYQKQLATITLVGLTGILLLQDSLTGLARLSDLLIFTLRFNVIDQLPHGRVRDRSEDRKRPADRDHQTVARQP